MEEEIINSHFFRRDPEKVKSVCWGESAHSQVHCNTLHNSERTESNKSIDRAMDKEITSVYVCARTHRDTHTHRYTHTLLFVS